MTHDDIAKKAAETIMQRANDTYPHTLHKDMLVDEIGKAIREATQRTAMPQLLFHAPRPINPYVVGPDEKSMIDADMLSGFPSFFNPRSDPTE